MVTLRRAQMVLLPAQGLPVAKIAEVTFTSADRVREVIHNFNADGLDSLDPKYSGGRPKRFTLSERREIKKITKSRPAEHGLPFRPGVWPSWPASWSPRARGGNHHHLVCRSCGAVKDAGCVVGHLTCLDPVDDASYLVDEADFAFWGLCPQCRPEAG